MIFSETQKCLKVVNYGEFTAGLTAAEAMVQCSLEDARLVPIRNCVELTTLLEELWDRYRTPHIYHLGINILYNNTIKSDQEYRRNWHLYPIVDRYTI